MSNKKLMAVDEQMSGEQVPESVVSLTDEHKKALRFLIEEKNAIAARTEQLKEDIAAIAEKLGTKPAKVNKLISLIVQEEKKGGVIREQSSVLDWVEQFFGSAE